MKKLFPLLAIIFSLQAGAQPYSISFAGDGLSTVKVENLTSGIVVDVPAGDVLLLSTPTGIPEVNNMKSARLKVYPNPMTDKSTLKILPPVAGDAIISVCDMTGKTLTQFKGYVDNSIQEFSLSGIKTGLHLINVQGNSYQFSEKLLSNGKSNGTAVITRVTNNIQSVAEKKSIMDSKGVQANIDMAYNAGERLKYTAESGNNKTVMTDIPVTDKTVNFTFTECKDGDDIYYPVVQIGTQLWMAENLKTTKYNDGTPIPNITDITTWNNATTGAYCDYSNTPANSTTYGRLYNWYVVDNNAATKVASNGGKNVCPIGWHVSTDAEWTTLTTYLGGGLGVGDAGGKLKETGYSHWLTPNAGATNESGFTARPGGGRRYGGGFENISGYGFWWATAAGASSIYMSHTHSVVGAESTHKMFGHSVRCIKD